MSAFAHPYARAFLEAAPAGYDVERFLADAGSLVRAIESDARLRAFLSVPAVPEEAKRKTIGELATRAGLDAFGVRFFEVMLKNRRLLEAGAILRSLREGWDAKQGVREGDVTVAAPIGEAERKALEEALASRLSGTVRLRVTVDPKILAGFVARVGSNVFDASAAAGIRRFREQAKGRTGA
jgi:F-type H+-transporting ATPase subunit delta